METDHTNNPLDREDQSAGYQNPAGQQEQQSASGQQEVSGDESTNSHERKRHHYNHGIGRYRSFSNYSSASDQPTTNTGPGLF